MQKTSEIISEKIKKENNLKNKDEIKEYCDQLEHAFEINQSNIEDTFMKQQDTIIFDDDDILNQIQNKLNTGSSNISNNQSIFAVNISGIQNIKNTSGFINPNFLRQNQIKEGKEDIIHSIYNIRI